MRRWQRVTTVVLLAVFTLAGCTDGAEHADVSEGLTAVPQSDRGFGNDADAPAAEEEAAEQPAGDTQASDLGDISSADPRRIIRDATVELVVEDADDAVVRIGDVARRTGGFVAGADLRRGDDRWEGIPPVADGEEADRPPAPLNGTLIIRVPSAELENVLADLKDLALVEEARTITSRDVSGEYGDLEARLRNLESYEQELLALLATIRERDDATPDTLLSIFERVRQVREEIERIEQRLAELEDRVSLSTVTIHLATSPELTVGGPPELWRPIEDLRAAARSLVATLQTVATAVIWLAVFVLPILLLLGLPVIGVGYGALRWRRTRNRPVEA